MKKITADCTLSTEIPAIVKWKNADYPPDEDLPIVWVSRNGRIGTFKSVANKSWPWLTEKYSILIWTYQESIIPAVLLN